MLNNRIALFAFFIFGFLQVSSIHAQTKKEIRDLFEAYIADMKAGKYEASVGYMYPPLFEIIPRDVMERAVSEAFKDTSTFIMSFMSLEITEMGEVVKEENLSYAIVKYRLSLVLNFVKSTTDEEIMQLAGVFREMYGAENFKFEHRKITVTTPNRMAVIKMKGDKKLYMLEMNEQIKPIHSQMMSPEFLSRAYGE